MAHEVGLGVHYGCVLLFEVGDCRPEVGFRLSGW